MLKVQYYIVGHYYLDKPYVITSTHYNKPSVQLNDCICEDPDGLPIVEEQTDKEFSYPITSYYSNDTLDAINL